MNIIYNKVIAHTKSVLFLLLTPLLLTSSLTSCLDTIILPEDKTVDEDFWKTKGDVSAMVNAAYAAMASEDVMTRLIVWSGLRSDEMVQSPSPTGAIPDALEEMGAVNMQTTSIYAQWASFYNVINRCNIVLDRAEAVMMEDPNYTPSDYESDRCQMLALRSLCYFFLVRNYRDVPYITEAYMNSSQNTQVGQSSPKYVVDQLIETLEGVAVNANCLRSNSYTTSEWRRVGWMTRDGVLALLADIYLWRASVMNSESDYRRSIALCDEVIESKRQQHVQGRNELEVQDYPLASGTRAYSDIFADQNAEESIFELQSTANSGLCKYLYKYSSNTSSEGWLKATNIFLNPASAQTSLPTSNFVFAAQDLRFYAATFKPTNATDDYADVRKMISNMPLTSKDMQSRLTTREFANFDQNYIIYRLTDVMLMKAEAEVQLMRDLPADSVQLAQQQGEISAWNDTIRQDVFNLVSAVNTRSINEADQATSVLKYTTYSGYGKNQMELFVMRERLRELCFEGKRWYDLLRYNYRHVSGVQYDRTFGELSDAAGDDELSLPEIYNEMLLLATRGRGNDASAIRAKMQNEAYLYLPVPNSDINVCPLLRQNPAYKDGNTYEKSY